MKFTASQHRALDLTRHLGITANAGSGKTRVLVERYVNILEQNPEIGPRNVVAITFTEASAGELRSRIVREIDDRIGTATSTGQLRRLESIRNDIKSGNIGTIHAFATRLLKAYPVEANVDASFGILSGSDQSLMQDDAISTVFFTVLQAAYDKDEEQDLLDLFRVFGRQEMTKIMESFFTNRSRVATVTKLLQRGEDDVIHYWESAIEAIAIKVISEDTVRVIGSIFAQSKECSKKNEGMLALSGLMTARSLHERMKYYRDTYKAIFTNTDTVRTVLIKDPEVLQQLESQIEQLVSSNALIAKISEFIGETEDAFVESHRLLYRHLQLIISLWDRVLQEYSERKTSIGLLDFDDLIEKAEKLLSIPRVASELTGRFRYIMIDEYQDTDESQYRIARALTEGFSDRNKLAVVGDPKQSIYCFRNADATVFAATLKEIKDQSAHTKVEDGIVSLQESFRMLAKPLAFINKVFGQVMEPSASTLATEEVQYEPLILGRTSGSQGSVEFLLYDEELESTDEDDAMNEGGEFGLIARKIKAILASETEYLVDDKGSLRTAKARDIAVILRSRTRLNELEASLRAEDIPYIVRKGAGFFAQQEITDVICYLKFLLVPSDDVSLLAILRSPFFSLNDTLLFQVAVNTRFETDAVIAERPLTLWERLQRYASKGSEVPQQLIRAIEFIKANLLLVGRVPIARLIEKILTESAVYATYSAGPHGSQRIANLRKFIDFARQADTSGFSTLFDFVERLQYQLDGGDSEAQADVVTDEDAIQIMTAHGAKGLEFPIVIVASLHREFNFTRVRVLDKDLGLMLNYPDTEKKSKRPAICELIRLRSDHNTLAEEKRVLYVALTRAKDHLIVSGTLNGRNKAHPLRWIMNAVSPQGIGDRPSTLKLLETIEIYDSESGKTSAEETSFDIAVAYRASDIEVDDSVVRAEQQFELGKLALDPIEVRYRPERFSATQLLTYNQCPTKYYLSYGLGIPEEPKLAYDTQPDELSERVRGAMAGQVIHAMLEQVNDLVRNGVLDVERFEKRFEGVITSLGITRVEESKPLRDRAIRDVSNFISSDFGKFVLSCDTFFTELPIQSQLDRQNSLYGIIDRLFQEPDGSWHLLDYKTDGRRRDAKQQQYAFQLGYYASLVKRLYPEAKEIKSTIFYTQLGVLDQKIYDLATFNEVESTFLDIIEGIRTDEKLSELKLLERKISHCEDCNYYNEDRKACVVPID